MTSQPPHPDPETPQGVASSEGAPNQQQGVLPPTPGTGAPAGSRTPQQPLPPRPPADEGLVRQAPGVPARPHSLALPVRQPGPFKRGFGLGAGAGAGVAVTLLVFGTVLSLIGFLGTVAAGAATQLTGGGTNLVTVWGPASAGATLRAVDVKGAILTESGEGGLLATGTYGYEVARMIDELEAADADGLVLRINTPGGTITGSRAIADAISRYQQRTGKKVFAHVQGLSASGGMYAMAGADDIQADHGSAIGSIGVIFGPLSRYRDVVTIDGGALAGGVTANGGIEQFYFTQGRGKDAGNPFRDVTDEEWVVFQQLIENEYEGFVNHVSDQRGIPVETIREELGAFLFDNKVAKEKGLIDGTMGVDEAYRHFATEAGLDPMNTKVVAAAAPGFLATVLGAERRVPGQSPAVTVQSGVRPVTASSICGPGSGALVFHGDPGRLCG